MKYQDLIILLPCHSLEDFPIHHEGEEAQGLMANWSALWHPALIAATGAMPHWRRADDPPQQVGACLLLAPAVSMEQLPTSFDRRVEEEGGLLIRRQTDRDEIVRRALEPLDGGPHRFDPELEADFLALGYCYLQVELLTRQMRYSSNLDEIHFERQVVAAAQALTAGDIETARQKLATCFDVLAEERDHYYPVDAFLLDLTLVASTTLGESLDREIARPFPTNLLLSAELLREIEQRHPATLEHLREGLTEGRIALVGGESREDRLPLMSRESLLDSLRHGLATYERLLDRRVVVYGRRRSGLTTVLPQVLRKLGFQGALHFTLEEGKFPEGSQFKIQWEGDDGSLIDALARAPLDAAKPETFLGLAVRMGESMDMDHVATVCLAHWPDRASVWYDDLRRISKYGAALGRFVTVDEYFRNTDLPGHQDRFDGDQYRYPHLKQTVIRREVDPISTSVRYWRNRTAAEMIENLRTLRQLVRGRSEPSCVPTLLERIDAAAEDGRPAEGESAGPAAESVGPGDSTGDDVPLEDRLRRELSAATDEFVGAVSRDDGDNGGAEASFVVVNPFSFVRRVGLETTELGRPATVERPIYSSSAHDRRIHTVVDVPPMGYVRVTAGGEASRSAKRASLPLVEDGVLRNEFLEATIHPDTGALRSLHDYRTRGNRFSQQLAFRQGRDRSGGTREPSDSDDAQYSVMRAERIETTEAGATLGEIVTQGKLLSRSGDELADFRQAYRLWRGSRVLQVDIRLVPRREPKADPWNSYFACRFAWPNESADLRRAVQQSRQTVRHGRFESPLYVEIDDGETRTTVLTGGLPFHRRSRFNRLDTLLIVRGETETDFRIGIGIDLKNSLQHALSLLAPPTCSRIQPGEPSPATHSWLFHIDHRGVVATHWEPVFESDKLSGFRARLLETQGKSARGNLSSFLPIRSARTVDFRGRTLADCSVEQGAVRFELSPHEWTEVVARTG